MSRYGLSGTDMFMSAFSSPSLVEPGVSHFLDKTLEQCHRVRQRVHAFIINTALGFLIILGFGVLVYVCVRIMPSPEEKRCIEQKRQQALLEQLQKTRQYDGGSSITQLPTWGPPDMPTMGAANGHATFRETGVYVPHSSASLAASSVVYQMPIGPLLPAAAPMPPSVSVEELRRPL